MKTFYVYFYIDPKSDLPIYVGKGKGKRAWDHFSVVSNPRLTNTLKKRIKEGYVIEPKLIYYPSEKAAYAGEIFWIAVYGREDIGTGTLFNKTDGGDAPPSGKGRKRSAEWIKAHSKPASEEKKSKQRLAMAGRYKGRIAYNKGVPCAQETKDKISKAIIALDKPIWNKGISMNNDTKNKISKSRTKYQFITPKGIFNAKQEMCFAFPEYTSYQLEYFTINSKNGFSRTLKSA